MLEKLISELQNTKTDDLIKINVTLPEEVMKTYNIVINAFVSYYYKSVVEYRSILQPKTKEYMEKATYAKQDVRSFALDEEFIFKIGGKKTLLENIREIVQRYVMLAGGCVSDFVISTIHNTEYKPKDVDIFINSDLLRGILNEKDYKNNLTYEIEKLMELILRRANLTSETDAIGAEVYREPHGSLSKLRLNNLDVELIVTDCSKFFRFDLNIRHFFANNNGVYTYRSVIEDIKRKEISLMTMHTPVTSLFRLFSIAKKIRFKIKDRTLLFLSMYLHEEDYRRFKIIAKLSSHYTYRLEREILSKLGVVIRGELGQNNKIILESVPKTKLIMNFPYEKNSIYNSVKGEDYYSNFINLTFNEDVPFYQPHIDTLFNMSELQGFTYKDTIGIQEEVFKHSKTYEETFSEWYSKNYLSSIFGEHSDYTNSLGSAEIELLRKFFFEKDYSLLKQDELDYNFVNHIPGVAMPELKFNIIPHYRSIGKGNVRLVTNFLGRQSDIFIYLDIRNKTIHPIFIDGDFLGLVSDHYLDFISQFKEHYQLTDYTLVSERLEDSPDTSIGITCFVYHLLKIENSTPFAI